MNSEKDYEKIRPGLYHDVQTLNSDAPKDRKISGKTLRKIFVNWMTLAGMDQNVADAIEARDDHNVSNVSYHSTADTKGKLQYPKFVKLFLLEYPIPEWMKSYEGNDAYQKPKRFSKEDDADIVAKLKAGWKNKDFVDAGICSAGKAAELAKKHNIDRSSRKGIKMKSETKKHIPSKDLWKLAKK